jgi:hypothetical protein
MESMGDAEKVSFQVKNRFRPLKSTFWPEKPTFQLKKVYFSVSILPLGYALFTVYRGRICEQNPDKCFKSFPP